MLKVGTSKTSNREKVQEGEESVDSGWNFPEQGKNVPSSLLITLSDQAALGVR